MGATLSEIVKILDQMAPRELAEDWDNVGLQIGDPRWHVRRIWTALDPSPEVVKAACEKGIDLLITHHPLIFRPLKSIDFQTPAGAIIKMASQHRLAIFSAHTNLDIARGGVNDVLARRLGLKHLQILQPVKVGERFKLVVYTPASYENKILKSLLTLKTEPKKTYLSVSSQEPGAGIFWMRTFHVAEGGHAGSRKVIPSEVTRIEILVDQSGLGRMLDDFKRQHSDQIIAYDVFSPMDSEAGQGIGRIGSLDRTRRLKSLALMVKEKLKINFVKLAGNPELNVTKVALCSGSGSSLMQTFLASEAQVYISGDIHYHDARDAETSNRAIIDIGHFPSEHLVGNALAQQLEKMSSEAGIEVEIEACSIEKDPFRIL